MLPKRRRRAALFDEVVNSIVERPQDQPSHIKNKNMPREESGKLPFAKWRGKIDLGGNELDCYVLDDGKRVLSSSSTTKAIADIDRGSLQDYIGQKNLNPFIDKDKILQETGPIYLASLYRSGVRKTQALQVSPWGV